MLHENLHVVKLLKNILSNNLPIILLKYCHIIFIKLNYLQILIFLKHYRLFHKLSLIIYRNVKIYFKTK